MTEIFKKTFTLVVALAICLGAAAQVQLQTKKFRLEQFSQTSTKIVLSGNQINDALLRDGVKKAWNISPYEFCDMNTFESEKTDSTKFFLVISESVKKNEEGTGILCINLFQGSGKKTMYRISSIPFCSAGDTDGREYTFLPLLLRTLQNNIEAMMEKEFNIGEMVKARVGVLHWDDVVCISNDDLATPVGASSMAAYNHFDITFTSSEKIDNDVQNVAAGKLVSYVVAPARSAKNARCYKMLIETSSGDLYYIGKHTLSEKNGPGFLKSDLDKILDHKK